MIPIFKKTLAKSPQIQEEVLTYIHSLCLASEEVEVIAEAIEFVKQLGRESFVNEALARLYLKMARFTFKEGENGQVNEEEMKLDDQTQIYLNHALKSLTTVEN